MPVYKKIPSIIIVILSILLFNSIATEPRYKILDVDIGEDKGLSLDYQTFIISVEQYYKPDDYKRIVCNVLKNSKQDKNENITQGILFYYKQEAWTVFEKVLGNIGIDPNVILVASYGRSPRPDKLLVSLSIYHDENGNRLDENIVLIFDHTCDCEK